MTASDNFVWQQVQLCLIINNIKKIAQFHDSSKMKYKKIIENNIKHNH